MFGISSQGLRRAGISRSKISNEEIKPSRMSVGLGGLGVMCSPLDQRFAGSNPAEVDGFFQKS